MTHFRLQRVVRSRMTFRGRGTARLCHPLPADEDAERVLDEPRSAQMRLGRAEDFQETLLFRPSYAEILDETREDGVQQPAASGVLRLGDESPAREGQDRFAARRLRRALALETHRVDALATPERASGRGIPAQAFGQQPEVALGERE